jgi:hypothetical protein
MSWVVGGTPRLLVKQKPASPSTCMSVLYWNEALLSCHPVNLLSCTRFLEEELKDISAAGTLIVGFGNLLHEASVHSFSNLTRARNRAS